MLKNKFLYGIIALLSLSLLLFLLINSKEEVVATYKGEKITQEEFYNYMLFKHGEETLNEMVYQREIYKKNIPYEVVFKHIKDYKNEKVDKEEFYQKTSQIMEDYENVLLKEKAKSTFVSEDIDFIEENYEREKVLYEISYIIIENEAQAQNAYALVTEGKTLFEVSQKYSKDSFSDNVITTGLLKKEDIPDNMFSYIENLNEGEISELIKEGNYYYIVELTRKEEKSYEEYEMQRYEDEIEELQVETDNTFLPIEESELKIKEKFFK